jgi:hypothetical protein
MNNKVVLAVAAVIIAAAGVGGGFVLARGAAVGSGGPGGGFARLSASDRTKLQTMSDAERQAFFKEKGINMPTGGPGTGAPGTGGGMMRSGGLLEGKVTSVDAEKVKLTLSSGGSATVYTDANTVIAAEEGATPKIVVGASVMVSAQPEASGVSAAKLIVVRK